MSENRADLFESGRGNVNSKSAYEAPVAEWHDLRVITLGGSPGEGDSGAIDTQQGPGSSSSNSNGNWGSNHYDGNSDDEYGNYV